jgi:ABC-type transport system substrate-binding protein
MDSSVYALSITDRTENLRLRSTYPGLDVSAPLDYRAYTSFEMATEANGFRGNPTGWTDPVYDDLFQRFDRSIVPADRDELIVRMELYLAETLGNAKLYYAARPIAVRNNVQGPKGMNLSSTYTWNIHEWTVGPESPRS